MYLIVSNNNNNVTMQLNSNFLARLDANAKLDFCIKKCALFNNNNNAKTNRFNLQNLAK